MSATIDISVESPRWSAFPNAAKTVRNAIGAALSDGDAAGAEVSAVLADDAQVRKLNRTWLGKDKATNVLSFPAPDEPGGEPRFLGDIVLACETIEREAAIEGKTFEHHLAHLTVHGVLHLLGYDHERDSDAETMERQERIILACLGIADPYAHAETRTAETA